MLRSAEPRYEIPEYSLTGDLLSFLNCGLQYRNNCRGSLPPAKPVQMWFGEFIHGVMHEAYMRWQQEKTFRKFPWDWDPRVREIEAMINRRLWSKGLNPTPRLYCPYDSSQTRQGLCPDAKHPHKLIASIRAELSINTWGQHIFPLIEEPEVRLKGIREMPNYAPSRSRCDYYGITGIADVISSVNLRRSPPGNLLLHFLEQTPSVNSIINKNDTDDYEILIDYKGMRRPATTTPSWDHHSWQLLTYAWLRSKQPDARRAIAGVVLYLNELAPSQGDFEDMRDDMTANRTDIAPSGGDLKSVKAWKKGSELPSLSTTLCERRSIRIIPVTEDAVNSAIANFDGVVDRIEGHVLQERTGSPISRCWPCNPIDRTCTACDFKTHCPGTGGYHPTVP